MPVPVDKPCYKNCQELTIFEKKKWRRDTQSNGTRINDARHTDTHPNDAQHKETKHYDIADHFTQHEDTDIIGTENNDTQHNVSTLCKVNAMPSVTIQPLC